MLDFLNINLYCVWRRGFGLMWNIVIIIKYIVSYLNAFRTLFNELIIIAHHNHHYMPLSDGRCTINRTTLSESLATSSAHPPIIIRQLAPTRANLGRARKVFAVVVDWSAETSSHLYPSLKCWYHHHPIPCDVWRKRAKGSLKLCFFFSSFFLSSRSDSSHLLRECEILYSLFLFYSFFLFIFILFFSPHVER